MSEEVKEKIVKNRPISHVMILRSIGQLFAVILSWALNKSFLWGFLHCLFGWWYVIYYYFEYGNLNTISDFIHALYK